MQLRYKVVLLAVVPLVVVAGLLAFVVEREGRTLTDGQVADVDQQLLDAKKIELQNLMAIARGAIRELEGSARDDDATRSQALKVLRGLDFGKDGYFYVYDLKGPNQGQCLMHPRRPELEHQNQWNLMDDHQQLVIQPLIKMARNGGGFVQYRWPRPSQQLQQSQQKWFPKLGYVVPLPRWGWMLGTGTYIDDIKVDVEKITRQMHASFSATIGDAMRFIAVIAVLAALVVAALGVALNVSQQRLAASKLRLSWQVVAAQEGERDRVSRELHDGVMHELRMVQFDLETALDELESHPPHGTPFETLKQGLAHLADTVDDIRRISHDLRSPLRGDGLPTFAQIGADFSKRTGVVVTVDTPTTRRPLSDEAAMALFQLTRQALDNVERHAGATRVAIRLIACDRRGSSGTSLTVSDNGCGFDVVAVEPRPGGGIGLLTMRERVSALGGELLIRSSPNGTEIEAFVPNKNPAEIAHK
jgi:two-component system NarL family sensor kinase